MNIEHKSKKHHQIIVSMLKRKMSSLILEFMSILRNILSVLYNFYIKKNNIKSSEKIDTKIY